MVSALAPVAQSATAPPADEPHHVPHAQPLFAGIQVCRDTCIVDEEVQTPLLDFFNDRHQQLTEYGEFAPVSTADLVQCLRREIPRGLLFTCDRERTYSSAAAPAAVSNGGPAGCSSGDVATRSQSPRRSLTTGAGCATTAASSSATVASAAAAALAAPPAPDLHRCTSSPQCGSVLATTPPPPPPHAAVSAAYGSSAGRMGSHSSSSNSVAGLGHRMRSPPSGGLAGVGGSDLRHAAAPSRAQGSPLAGHRSPAPTSTDIRPHRPTSPRGEQQGRRSTSPMGPAMTAAAPRPVAGGTTSPGGKASPRAAATDSRGGGNSSSSTSGPQIGGVGPASHPSTSGAIAARRAAGRRQLGIRAASPRPAGSPGGPSAGWRGMGGGGCGGGGVHASSFASNAGANGGGAAAAESTGPPRCRSPLPPWSPESFTGPLLRHGCVSPHRRSLPAERATSGVGGIPGIAPGGPQSTGSPSSTDRCAAQVPGGLLNAAANLATGGAGVVPRGRSPKTSQSPETGSGGSRSPSGGAAASSAAVGERSSGCGGVRRGGRGCSPGGPGAGGGGHVRRRIGRGSPPRAASPFNVLTDYDVLFELPVEVEWHRFEALVGVADLAAQHWPQGARARFLLIDEDVQTVLWESSDALEPWAPLELCSALLGTHGGSDAAAGSLVNVAAGQAAASTDAVETTSCATRLFAPRRLCLRVQCSSPPGGALWITPTITVRRSSVPRLLHGLSRASPLFGSANTSVAEGALLPGAPLGNADSLEQEERDREGPDVPSASSSSKDPGAIGRAGSEAASLAAACCASTQCSSCSTRAGDAVRRSLSGGGVASGSSWDEVLLFVGEHIALEIVAHLQCRDVARLLAIRRSDAHVQQSMWHCAFAHNFRSAYAKHFLRPLQGQPRPAALFHPPSPPMRGHAVGCVPSTPMLPRTSALPRSTSAGAVSIGTGNHRGGMLVEAEASLGAQPGVSVAMARTVTSAHPGAVPTAGQTQSRPPWRGYGSPQTSPLRRRNSGSPAAASPTSSSPNSPIVAPAPPPTPRASVPTSAVAGCVPAWALEVFEWRQICKKFYLSQLLCVSVNFQMYNCATPGGFLKDSGEIFHGSRGAHGAHPGMLRYGWNSPLGADHFLSRPSAVVAHRSPLGVAGVPPNVATVRGTAGPEPLAMTPLASEKDSSVVLPQAVGPQLRPLWTMEVDPGHYIVVVTVGDRNVGFAAYLEVGGQPIFCGEWIEAGTFKSRCVLCVATRGAITVGPHWPPRGVGTNVGGCSGVGLSGGWGQTHVLERGDDGSSAACGVVNELSPLRHDVGPASGTVGHVASASASSTSACGGVYGAAQVLAAGSDRHNSPPSPRGGTGAGSSPRTQPTRAELLARGTRLVSLRVAAVPLVREVERERRAALAELNQKIVEAKMRLDAAKQAAVGQSDKEVVRAQAKLSELHVQKAFKLFSFIAMCRRASPWPPAGQPPDPEQRFHA